MDLLGIEVLGKLPGEALGAAVAELTSNVTTPVLDTLYWISLTPLKIKLKGRF